MNTSTPSYWIDSVRPDTHNSSASYSECLIYSDESSSSDTDDSLDLDCINTHRTSASSSDCSEEYTSSIDNDSCDSRDILSDIEVVDDKLVIFNFYKRLSAKLSGFFSVELSDRILHLMSSYRNVSNGVLPTEIDYTEIRNCIAYLKRYAACHTALVFEAVSDIFQSSDVLLSKLNKKSLNVVFLGGGPGNDFVGFLTALYKYHDHLFDLDVTVVDKMSGWEYVFNETIEVLRQGDGGKAGSIFEEVNITTTFLSADLKYSEKWDERMPIKLQNADIVFFVKSLSHIPDGNKLQVLQNVTSCMKFESLLIYIDYPYPSEEFGSLINLSSVYQTWKTRYYLNHKDSTFSYSNIDNCQAVTRVFKRC